MLIGTWIVTVYFYPPTTYNLEVMSDQSSSRTMGNYLVLICIIKISTAVILLQTKKECASLHLRSWQMYCKFLIGSVLRLKSKFLFQLGPWFACPLYCTLSAFLCLSFCPVSMTEHVVLTFGFLLPCFCLSQERVTCTHCLCVGLSSEDFLNYKGQNVLDRLGSKSTHTFVPAPLKSGNPHSSRHLSGFLDPSVTCNEYIYFVRPMIKIILQRAQGSIRITRGLNAYILSLVFSLSLSLPPSFFPSLPPSFILFTSVCFNNVMFLRQIYKLNEIWFHIYFFCFDEDH